MTKKISKNGGLSGYSDGVNNFNEELIFLVQYLVICTFTLKSALHLSDIPTSVEYEFKGTIFSLNSSQRKKTTRKTLKITRLMH